MMYYTPDDVIEHIEEERDDERIYDPEMGSGGFLAIIENPPYEDDDGDVS